ncbi:MAG TPA: hypothetical protein VD861_02465 [Pyrinomonadaceae bacterium]|nr:hypothetical protein [Pyrinomonadaceae bacterium]
MISYRAQLAKIGEQPGTPVSYQNFGWRPASLRQAMRAMDFPQQFQQATEKPGRINEDWTEEIQGVVWDGAHWIFSSNGSQPEKGFTFGDSPKALYVFNGTTNFVSPAGAFVIAAVHPGPPGFTQVTPHIPPPPGFTTINHVGPLVIHNGLLYVEHWIDNSGHLIVCELNNGAVAFKEWMELESAEGKRVGMVGINPWDGTIFTCHGDIGITKLFLHGLDGKLLKRKDGTVRELSLTPPINDNGFVQGGAVSPNGHIYIASGRRQEDLGRDHQFIYCYSALNGHLLNTIAVLAEDTGQELEGVCYADVTRAGHHVQLHAVLLDNFTLEKDDIFLKSFAASEPDLV